MQRRDFFYDFLCLVDPLLNDLFLDVDKDEAKVVIGLLLLLLKWLHLHVFLTRLVWCLKRWVMEVSNALNNLVVGTFEVDFHNKDVLTTAERLPACTSKHLLGSEFSLLHTFDLLNRDHNGWLVREALVVNLILVNE